MKKYKVAILILNYNGKQDTLDCLKSIDRLITADFRYFVIIVDNGSSDGSVKAIAHRYPRLILIENDDNLGFSEGNNLGIKKALDLDSDFVLILNNDTLVDPALLNNLLRTAIQNEAAIVSPKIYFAPGYEFHRDRYTKRDLGKVIWYAGGTIDWKNVLTSHRGVDQVDEYQFEKDEETDFATGCAMLVKREVFEKVGLLDPLYFAYFEDVDLSLRAIMRGYKIFFSPKAILWHKNAASFQGSGSSFQDYFVSRNRLIFGLRYAPFRAKIALLKESVRLLITGTPVKRKAISDAFCKRIPEIREIKKL